MAEQIATCYITVTNAKAIRALTKCGKTIHELIMDGFTPDYREKLEKALHCLDYAAKRMDVKMGKRPK